MLVHDVSDAVKAGKFNIWAISSIDEGLLILTGTEPGKMAEKGGYTPGSIYSRVYTKLKGWYEKASKQKNNSKAGKRKPEEDHDDQSEDDDEHGGGTGE